MSYFSLMVARAVVGATVFVCATGFAQESRSATIKSVQGSVVLVQGENRRTAEPGVAVVERDRIVTGANSATALSFRDGTTVMVGPNSAMDLSNFQFDSTKQEGSMVVGLLHGSIRFISGLIGKYSPDRVKISSSTATVGIRGPDFILEAP